MEAPKYLNSLELVAKRNGGFTDLRLLGEQLQCDWGSFEEEARIYGYDILAISFNTVQMQKLVQLLYHTPGANWEADCRILRIKDKDYGGSWHRRGGPGAFMMLARKWDRIELAIKDKGSLAAAFANDTRTEGIVDDIADLRCYLLLVLSWHTERANPTPEPIQEDMPF